MKLLAVIDMQDDFIDGVLGTKEAEAIVQNVAGCRRPGLTGVWFDGEKYFAYHLETQHEEKDTQLLQQTKRWLDIYFNGKEPDFTVPCHRVIGANGSLTGYAAGLNKKIKLLTLEKADVKSLFMPKPAGGD